MKTIGMTLWILGALVFLAAAMLFDTTVSNYSSSFGATETFNIGLQQSQLLAAMAGLTMFLSGTIIHCLATLLGPETPLNSADSTHEWSTHVQPVAERSEADLQKEMDELGIVKEGEQYRFSSYRYDQLTDAIRYARANQSIKD